ncbi:hypothetical protein GURASL_27960 [Geotalea uraniireducens]|uniref:Uncharacterized protein n=1 Tax=Geotalea uraniireducens TaxID=351604 RepID=A0ABN6VUA2_9BACT|nr:hypothetical protein [Geotalea uraniireducens]BDV43873.1 hypothetical protein GURASL_27960 [Geotalea uraniireducens]
MYSIDIDRQKYTVIAEKEVEAGRHYRKEALCADAAGKMYLLWTEREQTSAIVSGTFQLVGRHFIAELTDLQAENWKTNRFDDERVTLKGSELTINLNINALS